MSRTSNTPGQKFAFFNKVQLSAAVQDPTINHRTPLLVNPGRTHNGPVCREGKTQLPVFSSHMDTHTELLLTPAERREEKQPAAPGKAAPLAEPWVPRNPPLPPAVIY